MLSYIFICIRVLQVLEACCFVPVTSNAFTLQMEDGITSIYFARNERQRNAFFELMSKLPSESNNFWIRVLRFSIMSFSNWVNFNKICRVSIGEKLGNVWGLFGQYPTILARMASNENSELAIKVQMQVIAINAGFPW